MEITKKFHAIFEHSWDGGYTFYVPYLPGYISKGKITQIKKDLKKFLY